MYLNLSYEKKNYAYCKNLCFKKILNEKLSNYFKKYLFMLPN